MALKKKTADKVNPMAMLKNKRKSLADEITESLEDKGVTLFKPKELEGGTLDINMEYLQIPSDLTDEPSRELGQYLNAFTQSRMYHRTLVGWQMLEVEQAKRDYYDVSTPLYSTLTKKEFPSETSKERFINNHPQVKDFFLKLKDEKRKMDLLQLNLASIDDAIFLISREISRRTGDWNTENRNESVQRR